MDALNEHLKNKIHIINEIKDLELKRKNTIKCLGVSVKDVSELLDYMQSKQVNDESRSSLEKYNKLLIDIITKIQKQRKKNQNFINKATHNLRNIREDISGQRLPPTYNSRGREQHGRGF